MLPCQVNDPTIFGKSEPRRMAGFFAAWPYY